MLDCNIWRNRFGKKAVELQISTALEHERKMLLNHTVVLIKFFSTLACEADLYTYKLSR